MTAVKALFVVTFAVFLSDVTSWIVDMAEVEKFLDEEQFIVDGPDYDEENLSGVASEGDNEVMYTANYAENFNYETYKKKEVENVIKNGGVYLEGLSHALAAYKDTLDECSRNSTKLPPSALEPGGEELLTECEKAEKTRHYVQKLSEVALHTTDKLRDNAYDNKNQDDSGNEADLIQLAWTLDRLASLTGYETKQKTPVEFSSSNNIQDETPALTTEASVNAATEDHKQLEILEQVENGRPLSRFPPKLLTDVKSVQKRDTVDVMRYYLKYKVWNGSNPMNVDQNNYDSSEFDIQNSLKVLPIRKRSLEYKKAANMKGIIQKIRHLRCKLRERSKTSARKLVKHIKVYRRKVFTNKNTH